MEHVMASATAIIFWKSWSSEVWQIFFMFWKGVKKLAKTYNLEISNTIKNLVFASHWGVKICIKKKKKKKIKQRQWSPLRDHNLKTKQLLEIFDSVYRQSYEAILSLI